MRTRGRLFAALVIVGLCGCAAPASSPTSSLSSPATRSSSASPPASHEIAGAPSGAVAAHEDSVAAGAASAGTGTARPLRMLEWNYTQSLRTDPPGSIVGGIAGALIGSVIKGDPARGSAAGALGGAGVGGQVESPVSGEQGGLDITPHELRNILLTALLPARREGPVLTLAPAASDGTERAGGWSISGTDEGRIVTDWKRIAGKKAGILYWQKEYQAQVRHIITIQQSFQSRRYTNFVLRTYVRERPNENYPWSEGDAELGRTSFEEIKTLLLEHIRLSLVERRTRK